MGSQFISVKLDSLPGSNDSTQGFTPFAGQVVDSLESWKGQSVIGLTGKCTKVTGDVLENQPIYQVTTLPPHTRVEMQLMISNLKPLFTALLCDYLYIRSRENETIVILSDSWENALPFVQWMLLKNAQIIVCIPKHEDESAKKIEWSRHAFFKHPSFKSKSLQVTLRSVNDDEIADNVLKITKYGASAILVLGDAFKTEQVKIHRQVLLAAGLGSRVVWCSRMEQIDPCECDCLFDKGISLGFFNLDSILSTESHIGIVQHAIIETVNHMANSTLFVS